MSLDAYMEISISGDRKIVGESSDESDDAKRIEILSFEHSLRMPNGIDDSMFTVKGQLTIDIVNKIMTQMPQPSDEGGPRRPPPPPPRARHAALTILKPIDFATPSLAFYSLKRQALEKVRIVVRGCLKDAVSSDVLCVTLFDTYISRYQVSADPLIQPFGEQLTIPILADEDLGPLEMIDFTYKQIEWRSFGQVSTRQTNADMNFTSS